MRHDKITKLAELVKSERKKQGLTQEQLAAMTGVGIRFVREFEKGKKSCHIGKALMVASMLGLQLQVNGEDL